MHPAESTPEPPRYLGLILAAGRSRRMGALKPLLPWPDREHPDRTGTVIAAAFDTIAPWCAPMVVVAGDAARDIERALRPRTCEIITSASEAPMFSSIKAGLRHAQSTAAHTDLLMHPADVPAVARATVAALVAAHRAQPDVAVMPEHDGRGGHPVIIPYNLFEPILRAPGRGGLRQVWEDHPPWRVRLPVDDPRCVADLDNPADYDALREGLG